jgi:tetratricopeptide (TPR) repeat protein
MAVPLSKAPPPPTTAEQREQRVKQKRLVLSTLGVFLVLLAAWQVYEYVASAEQRAEQRVQEGREWLSPGRYEHAIEKFDQALEIDPKSWNAYLQRGIARQGLSLVDGALADFQNALSLRPDLLEARIARADLFRQKGDVARAIDELSKVIELKPAVDAHYSRGLAYAQLGDHEKAISDFTWVIDELRDAPFAYFARAKSKRALGDTAGAYADEKTANSFSRGVVR